VAIKKIPASNPDYIKYLLDNIDNRLSKIEKSLSRLRLSDVAGATDKRITRPEMLVLKADIPFEGFNWYPSMGNIIWSGPASLSTIQVSIDRADPKICQINYIVANKNVEIISIFVDGMSVEFQNDSEAGTINFKIDLDTTINGETEFGILVNRTVSAKINAEDSKVFWVGYGLKDLIISPVVK
jgi:hypothetical protein